MDRPQEFLPHPPPSSDEPWAFLIGAGCSSNLPTAKSVTDAVVKNLAGGTRLPRKYLEGILDHVRLEQLLQTVRDILNTDLSVLSDVYGSRWGSAVPNRYHYALAQLLLSTGHSVLTTNFDVMIEEAYYDLVAKNAYTTVFPHECLRVLYSDDQRWDRPSIGRTLMKLHGSVVDIASLCATFDSVAAATHSGPTKHRAFREILQSKSLCVIGCGGWYDDVLEVLLETEARERYLYWFAYNRDGENTCNSYADGATPRSPAALRAWSILTKLVRDGNRHGDRVSLFEGNSENSFFEFLDRFNLPIDARTLPETPDSKVPHKTTRKVQISVQDIVDKWLSKVPDDTRFLRRLALMDVAYIAQSSVDIPTSLARAVEEGLEGPDGSLTRDCLGRSRLASAWYATDMHARAADEADKGIKACTRLLSKTVAPDPVHAIGLIESYAWKAEAQRWESDLDGALATISDADTHADELEKQFATDPNGPFMKRFARARAALRTTHGQVLLTKGQLAEAGDAYTRAAAAYHSEDLFWLLYSKQCLGQVRQLQGHLKEAEKICDEIDVYLPLVFDGGVQYLSDWSRLARLDLCRIWVAHGHLKPNWAELSKQLDSEIGAITDSDVQRGARAIQLELRWLFADRNPTEPIDEADIERAYMNLMPIGRDVGSIDWRATLRLSYAAFLKSRQRPQLEKARSQAHKALRVAKDRRWPLLTYWATLELLDIARLQGRKVGRESATLASTFEAIGYPLAQTYALLIGHHSGQSVEIPDYIVKFLAKNGLGEIKRLLGQPPSSKLATQGVRLVFPGAWGF